jgi:hypothetical protein
MMILSPYSVQAESANFELPECRAVAIKLSQETGATFRRFGAGKKWAFFYHPFGGEFGLYCEPGILMKLSFSDRTLAPAKPWYDLASVAAMSVGADMFEVDEAAQNCMIEATSAADERGRVERKPLLVTCSTTGEPYVNLLTIYSYTDAGWKFYQQ